MYSVLSQYRWSGVIEWQMTWIDAASLYSAALPNVMSAAFSLSLNS